MSDEVKKTLQGMGYMVLKIEPTIWRVRGQGDEDDWRSPGKYIDVWALHGLYRMWFESGKAKPYTDIIAVVQANLKPWPPMRTPEQEAAYVEWRDRLDCVLHSLSLRQKNLTLG